MIKERIFNRLEAFTNINRGIVKTAAPKKKQIVVRKELQKRIEVARQTFVDTREAYEKANEQLAKQQTLVDELQNRMNDARQDLLETSEKLQTMDLTGTNACRDRKGVTTFYHGNKEYVVEGDAPNKTLLPYKEYLRKEKEKSLAEESDEVCDNGLTDPDIDFASDILSQTISRV
jgi:hypothetical protein